MVTRSPLVGRAVERAALDAVLARCRTGAGGLILVSGDAGVGKSRLVREVLADWDGCVLHGTATPEAGAYAPVAEVLRTLCEEFGDDALPDPARTLLSGSAGKADAAGRPALTAAVSGLSAISDAARQR